MSIGSRLEKIRSELGEVKRPVQIIGVTKFQPVEKIKEAVDAGLGVLANNYAQEGETLMRELGGRPLEWHFIGHIQSRKIKYLTAYDWVHSLDRSDIAASLSARAVRESRTINVLVEVNIGEEAQKSGVPRAQLRPLADEIAKLPGLRLRGLMGMPPPLEPVERRRPFFRELFHLFEAHRADLGWDALSMGTSADYLVAVQEGATMIRLGTTLFGERPPRTSVP